MHLELSRHLPWWALPLLAALALASAVWATGRLRAVVGLRRALGLAALRVLAWALLLLVVFEPVLVQAGWSAEEAQVAVIFDTSRSMELADALGADTRRQVAVRLWTEGDAALGPALARRFTPRLFAGATRARELPADAGATRAALDGALTVEGGGTDLRALLREARAAVARDRLHAVVVFTDGAETRPGDWLPEARECGVPVFPVGLGTVLEENERFHDLAVLALHAPARAYRDQTLELTAELRLLGADAEARRRPRTVTLTCDGRELARRDVRFDDAQRRTVVFEVVPDAEGDLLYEVAVEAPDEDPALAANNRAEAEVTIAAERLRVLYLEGELSSESGRRQQYLKREDPDLEYTIVLRKIAGERLTVQSQLADGVRGLPLSDAALAPYRVVLLGTVTPDLLDADGAAALARFVGEQGGGLLFAGLLDVLAETAQQAPALADLLPVALPDECAPRAGEFAPGLTDAGQRHPVLRDLARDFADGVLTFTGYDPPGARKPGATALLIAPAEDGAAAPLLSVQTFGRGRVALLNAGPTYRWYRSRSDGGASPYHRFWGQLLRWLAGADTAAGDWALEVAPRRALVDEPVTVTLIRQAAEAVPPPAVTVAGPEAALGAAVAGAPAAAAAGSDAGTPLAFQAADGEGARLIAAWTPAAPGSYRVAATVAGPDGPRLLRRRVQVGGEDRELRDPGLNEALLAEVARATGGEAFTVLTAARLPARLEEAVSRRAEVRRWPLAHGGSFFVALLAALTLEWVWRRRAGLL